MTTLQRNQWRDLYVSMDADGDGSGLLDEDDITDNSNKPFVG